MSKDFRGAIGQEQSCELNRIKVLRNRNVLSLDLNTASEPLSTVQLFREFQTVGAVQRKARSAKCVLVVGFCSSRCDEEIRLSVGGKRVYLCAYNA